MKNGIKKWAGVFFGLLCFLSISGLPIVTNASDDENYDYYFESYSVNAQVHKNATMTVTETLHANFNAYKHGIYRDIPRVVKVKRKVDGKVKTYTYQVKVKVQSVEGAPYEVETEYGYYNVIIGDEDETVIGPVTYVITYDYDFGDDGLAGSDELYYSLIGTGWQVPTKTADFSVTFDKDADVSDAHVYVGRVDGNDESRAVVTKQGNTISGTVTNGLAPNEAVTVFLSLPKDYYEGARTTPFIIYYSLIGAMAVLFVFVIIRKLKNKVKKTVKTVEFYPPDDMSSAEVGYIIDESADDKDLISLIFWLAHNGYLTISGEEKNICLTKTEKSTEGLPDYIIIFYEGLFRMGHTCHLSSLDYQFSETIENAKGALEACFVGKRKLSKDKIRFGNYGWMFVAALLSGLFIFVIGGMSFNIVNLLLPGAVIVFWTLLGMIAESHFKAIIFSAIAVIFSGIMMISGTVYAVGYMCIAVLMPLPAIIVLAKTSAATDYRIDMMGRLLGLKDFIKKAELEKLNLLVEENPDYFYDVLPYAYVFGLTDKWAKKFEHIAVKQPEWYACSGHPFTTYYMVRSMSYGMNHSLETVHASALSQKASEAGSGGSFGGGGGFSGGGFGGGGGGSW